MGSQRFGHDLANEQQQDQSGLSKIIYSCTLAEAAGILGSAGPLSLTCMLPLLQMADLFTWHLRTPTMSFQERGHGGVTLLRPVADNWHIIYFCHIFFSFKILIYFNWRIITLQYCDFFLPMHQHDSATGIHVSPHDEPPSHLPPHPIPLGCPRALHFCHILLVQVVASV